MGATWLSEIHFRCVMLERTRGWSEGIASPFSKWYSLYLGKPTERDGWFVIRGNEIKAAWDSIGVANGIHRKNWCDLTSIIIIRRERNRVRVPAKKEKLIFNTRKRKPSRPWRCSRSFFFVFFFLKFFAAREIGFVVSAVWALELLTIRFDTSKFLLLVLLLQRFEQGLIMRYWIKMKRK